MHARLIFLSLFIATSIFSKETRMPTTITLKLKETVKVSEGLNVEFVAMDHESATTGADSPPIVYGVYHFKLLDRTKSGNISLPVETLEAPWHEWEKYRFKLTNFSTVKKSATLMIKK